MKRILLTVAAAAATGALAIWGAYLERGCWAVGMEWAVPVLTAALLLYIKEEKHE